MNNEEGWNSLHDVVHLINDYTGKGIEVIEKIANFAKDRAALENEYSVKLKALIKKHGVRPKGGDSDLMNSVTFIKGYYDVVGGLQPIAAQHELIAENLKTNVIPLAIQKMTEYKQAKKQLETDNANLVKHMNNVIAEMNKTQKEYGKSFKEAEAAMLKYAKAEKNMEISRLELEKTKNNYHVKLTLLDESKRSYAGTTIKANEEQAVHYEKKVPTLLENYRRLHENRIHDTIDILNKCVQAESDVLPIIGSCHNDMKKDIMKIDPIRDGNLVVENMRTGHARPAPFTFDDLGSPKTFLSGSGAGSIETIDSTMKKGTLMGTKKDSKVARKQSMHQKFFGGGSNDKKDNGDYGTLPPQQRARKLQAKIGELEKDKDRAVSSREGVIKMQMAYRENPKLGNPVDCDAQIAQYGREIDALCNDIQKYRIQLDDVNAQMNGLTATSVNGSDTPPSIRSVSSASSGVTSRVNTINDSHRTNGGGGRRQSFTGSGSSESDPSTANGNGRDEFYEEVKPTVVGEAIAQFAFDGSQDGTIRMEANEKLWLIEKDEGDGWTRVRKENNSSEGFVPSSYLKTTWFSR